MSQLASSVHNRLGRRAYLFPFIGLRGGWTWNEILAFHRGVLWLMVAGNLVFGGWMVGLFVPGLWRGLTDPEMPGVLFEYPPIMGLYLLLLFIVLVGVMCLYGGLRLVMYLVHDPRSR